MTEPLPGRVIRDLHAKSLDFMEFARMIEEKHGIKKSKVRGNGRKDSPTHHRLGANVNLRVMRGAGGQPDVCVGSPVEDAAANEDAAQAAVRDQVPVPDGVSQELSTRSVCTGG